MENKLLYVHGDSPVQRYAAKHLSQRGVRLTDDPSPEVGHLLLGVPSFDPTGGLKGGGTIQELLSRFSPQVTVIGGGLTAPIFRGYACLDLLEEDTYLAKNAAITADCALTIGAEHLDAVLPGCPVLIIGWGRIGKCLAAKLQALRADVAVAARNPKDRAMLQALGFRAEDPARLGHGLIRYRLIYNTAPTPVLSAAAVAHCRADCVCIDLASQKGIAGDRVIWARGLPGKCAPASSGALIAESILGHFAQKEVIL